MGEEGWEEKGTRSSNYILDKAGEISFYLLLFSILQALRKTDKSVKTITGESSLPK